MVQFFHYVTKKKFLWTTKSSANFYVKIRSVVYSICQMGGSSIIELVFCAVLSNTLWLD